MRRACLVVLLALGACSLERQHGTAEVKEGYLPAGLADTLRTYAGKQVWLAGEASEAVQAAMKECKMFVPQQQDSLAPSSVELLVIAACPPHPEGCEGFLRAAQRYLLPTAKVWVVHPNEPDTLEGLPRWRVSAQLLTKAGYRSFELDTTTTPGYAWLRTGL